MLKASPNKKNGYACLETLIIQAAASRAWVRRLRSALASVRLGYWV